jgi:hypothetical protein
MASSTLWWRTQTRDSAPFPKPVLEFSLDSGLVAAFEQTPGNHDEEVAALNDRMLPALPEPPQTISRVNLREVLRVNRDLLAAAVRLGLANGTCIELKPGELSRSPNPGSVSGQAASGIPRTAEPGQVAGAAVAPQSPAPVESEARP